MSSRYVFIEVFCGITCVSTAIARTVMNIIQQYKVYDTRHETKIGNYFLQNINILCLSVFTSISELICEMRNSHRDVCTYIEVLPAIAKAVGVNHPQLKQ